jgi:hypothetical protein
MFSRLKIKIKKSEQAEDRDINLFIYELTKKVKRGF